MTRRIASLGMVAFLIAAMTAPVLAHGFTPGSYYASGTVRPLGFSIYMEGTHYLEGSSGGMICLLSSYYYDLSSYEGAKVTVSGWTEHSVEGSTVHMDVTSLKVITPAKTTMPFTILEKSVAGTGWNTADLTKRKFVIRDAATWTLFHRLHKAGTAAPKVDFAKYQVLAAFMGVKPTGGYSITISKVEKSGTSVFVTTKSTSPGPGTIVTMALTNPFVLATTLKTSGKAHFDGKLVKVLTVNDFKTDPNSLLVIGHVTTTGTFDLSKIKVGAFSMDARARYFMWPGTMPGDVSSVDMVSGGTFVKEIVPDSATGNPYLHHTVIVWEDVSGDNSTSGDTLTTSEGFTHSGSGTWKGDLGGTHKGTVQVELELVK